MTRNSNTGEQVLAVGVNKHHHKPSDDTGIDSESHSKNDRNNGQQRGLERGGENERPQGVPLDMELQFGVFKRRSGGTVKAWLLDNVLEPRRVRHV
ncbi:hypothetical protein WICPIJ_001020 [Wickerhamomyces pijperi]|uniref:Uncharacterized protein n=1 Tax=Wickerhamomyces pijperi TaxID=599730 RepID=A0A9P8TRT6_WICPI|nr:hypothetical protein WICPIJ_001020 [Wickerhamomyces pijperi]